MTPLDVLWWILSFAAFLIFIVVPILIILVAGWIISYVIRSFKKKEIK